MMHTHPTRLKSIGENLLLGTLYYLLARLGLWFLVADSTVSPVWPAGGIAWAAVLIFGPRLAPGIWLGFFAINLQFLLPLKAWSAASVATASTIALGSALQALVAFFLIRRAMGSVPRSPREIFLFLAIAAASCVMTPSLGVAGMCLNGIIQWQNYWALWRPWWFGDFTAVAIVTPLVWTLGSAPKRGLLAGALFPLTCFGVGVSLLAFFGIRRIGDNTIAETFARNGADIANTIHRSVDARMSDLALIGAFHSASNAVERSEFRDFVEPLLTTDQSITTFAWVPRVAESEREAFIAEARRNGLADFKFKHYAAGKEQVPDSNRSDAFPIYFIEPAKGSESEIGLDLASDPERRRVIEKMRDLGKAVAAPAMREGVEKTGAKGIAFYWPVFHRNTSVNSPVRQREELKGFYMVSFRIGDLMEDALNYLSPTGIDVYLLDESDGPEGELLYAHPSRPDGRVQEAASLRTGPQYVQTLKVGTRTWSVLCKPGPDYFPNRRSSLPWVVLIFGLGSTGLLGVFINNQQRAEAALRRLNKDLDTLVQQRTAELAVVETANYAIVSADSKGRIIGWNKGASAIFGMEEEAMRGKELTVLIPERHRAAHTRGMERFIATGEAKMIGKTVELDGLRKDGAEFPVEMSLSTWKLAGETYFSAIMRDVTDRKTAAKALRRSEEELHRALEFHQAVINNMGEGLYVVDSQGLVAYINAAAERLFGWSGAELIGRNVHEMVHYKYPDGRPFPAAECAGLQSLIRGENMVDYEDVFIRKDGTFFPVVYSSSPIKSVDGIVSWVVVFRDVTAQKEAFAASEESRARLAGIVGSAMDAILTFDAGHHIILFNAAAEQILSCPAWQAIGSRIDRFIPRLCGEANHECGFDQTDGALCSLSAVRLNGEEFPIEASISRVKVGERMLFTIILRDITERKRAREQIEEALRKEMALRREVHHRVKNNLQVISSLLYLQSNHLTDAGTREVLREGQSRVHSIALIHENLYASNDVRKIELSDYIRQLAADLFQTYKVNQNKIVIGIDSDKVCFGLDEAIPCGLLLNELVSNALKHAFPNGRAGSIGVELRSTGNGYLRLSVTDDGTGLPRDFDPEKPTTFGLKLIHDLTRQLNGTIRFQTDHGTAVTVTFPSSESVAS